MCSCVSLDIVSGYLIFHHTENIIDAARGLMKGYFMTILVKLLHKLCKQGLIYKALTVFRLVD